MLCVSLLVDVASLLMPALAEEVEEEEEEEKILKFAHLIIIRMRIRISQYLWAVELPINQTDQNVYTGKSVR